MSPLHWPLPRFFSSFAPIWAPPSNLRRFAPLIRASPEFSQFLKRCCVLVLYNPYAIWVKARPIFIIINNNARSWFIKTNCKRKTNRIGENRIVSRRCSAYNVPFPCRILGTGRLFAPVPYPRPRFGFGLRRVINLCIYLLSSRLNWAEYRT